MRPELQKYCIDFGVSILEAIRGLEASGSGFAIAVDEGRFVRGVLTDGDIRRALLGGNQLNAAAAPFIQKEFLWVKEDVTRSEVLDLMQALQIRHVPILSAERELSGLHSLHSIIGHQELPNIAVIMAGGKGTRLRPITEHIPKPMVEVAGRPILERLVLHLVGHGIREIYLAINYLGEQIERHFGDGSNLGCRIRYIREKESLGTAGAMSLLPEKPKEPFLVMNGDLVTQVNFERMLLTHRHLGNAATVAVRNYLHEVPFGCVEEADGRIRGIEEKPSLEKLINAGIYVLSPSLLEHVPQQYFHMTDLLQKALGLGLRCGTFHLEEDWADIGQIHDLALARGH